MLHRRVLSFVRSHPLLLKGAQKARFLVMCGPWRTSIIRYYRIKKTGSPAPVSFPTLFPDIDARAAAASIESVAYSPTFQVPQELIQEIIEFRNGQWSEDIFNAHRNCQAVARIAGDPSAIAVAREYLGAEPILYAARIYYTAPKLNAQGRPFSKNGAPLHYDVCDFQYLNLFVYLSDVDSDTSPHVVVESTHKQKSLQEILHPRITLDEADRRFASDMKTITGPSGTAFFEDSMAWHMMRPGKQGRWMLAICYTLSRHPTLARSV
jgi:hypothetical protein